MAKKKPVVEPEEESNGEVPKKTRGRGNDRRNSPKVGASSGTPFYEKKLKAKGQVAEKRLLPRPSSVGFAGRCVLNPQGAPLAGPHRRS